jgi:hypothetical protein
MLVHRCDKCEAIFDIPMPAVYFVRTCNISDHDFRDLCATCYTELRTWLRLEGPDVHN